MATQLARMSAARGISVRQLAVLVGMSKSTVGRWMSGQLPTPVKHRNRIAKVLGVPENDLFGNRASQAGAAGSR